MGILALNGAIFTPFLHMVMNSREVLITIEFLIK
jgi:hypothetical protein